MPLAETALDYWRKSQHFQALSTQAERELFVLHVIAPDVNSSHDPQRRRLLGRLADRAASAAA